MFTNCVFWIGVVENNEDLQKRGRVQVRIFGAHDVYNPPMTDSDGKILWGNTYGGSVSGGSMPRYSANGRKELFIWQRYNNPMNLKNVDGTWRRFDDISMAYPAYVRQLGLYHKRGKVTPRQMIATWAPAKENNLANYYSTVTQAGVGIDTPIDMNNPDQVAVLLRGMTIMESGNRFSIDDIKSAMAGNIVPSMTAVSTVYKDGQLYTGSSNAVEGIDGSTPGTMPKNSAGLSENANANVDKAKEEAAKQDATKQEDPAKQGAEAQKETTPVTQVPQQSGSASTATSGPDNTGHLLPKEDLPWAVVLYPASDYGGTTFSTLPAPQVQNGAWVFGVAIDGDFLNQLFIIGVIPNNMNIDALSTNPGETGTPAITGSTNGSGSTGGSGGTAASKMPTVTGVKTNGMTFAQLQDGIWNGESDRSTNKATSSSYAYGAMQLMPATAATYLLQGAASEELAAAGWTLDAETKAMLEEIRYGNGGSGYWGAQIATAMEKNSKIEDFCNLLQTNDTLNMALGTAYLRDCIGSSQGNGDPLLAALYYNQGVPNAHKIMDAIGCPSYNEKPAGMSNVEFVSKVNEYVKAEQNNDFKIYTDKIFASIGGVAALDQ